MNLTEEVMAEELDAIIRRSTNRLAGQSVRLSTLQKGRSTVLAKATFDKETAALARLKAYRSRFA